jgi:hypothetical protein
MIDLINALMHQQHGFVIWRNENSGERPLPERHSASLDFEGFVDTDFDLRPRGSLSIGEEMGSDFARGGGREGGFC